MQTAISILPGDKRMEYVAEFMAKKGGRICSSCSEIPDSGFVICGAPFTKDGNLVNTSMRENLSIDDFLGILNSSHTLISGNIPEKVIHYCTHHGIRCYDFLTSADLAQKNARLTAEGLLIPLLSHTSFSTSDFCTFIIGYGKCGREIATILRMFSKEIYIYDTNYHALKSAKSRHYQTFSPEDIEKKIPDFSRINTVVNTAPGNPFSGRIWQRFPDTCKIFQVASGPLELPASMSGQLILCPGIPGHYAPETAGHLIAKDICSYFHL